MVHAYRVIIIHGILVPVYVSGILYRSVNLFFLGFDYDLIGLLGKLSQNQFIKKLGIGRNMNNIKPRLVYISKPINVCGSAYIVREQISNLSVTYFE